MNCSLLTVTHGRRYVFSVVWLALLGAGCGADPSADLAMEPDGRNPGGATAQPELTLTFNEAAGLVLAPREARLIEVRIAPPAVYQVRFSLLDNPTGEHRRHDATLTDSLVDTDSRGRARAELTAPSTPSKLLLRAEVNGHFALLPISVGESDRTTIEVFPNYTGRRSISEWRASVHVGSSCADLPAGIASDGDPFARVPVGAPLRIEQVPLASPIAVVVRAGEFANGCSTLLDATDGGLESVSVTVTDRPLQLAETVLDVSFGLQPDDPVFSAALNVGDRLLHAAFVGEATDEVAALLNAMQVEAEITPGRAEQFASARAAAAWDTRLRTSLFRGAHASIAGALRSWSGSARKGLLSARAFEGRLTAATHGARDDASLHIDRVGEVGTAELSFSAQGTRWEVDHGDTLAFASTLSWSPTELSAALAEGPASAETGATDVPAALAIVVGCAQLGAAIASGTTPATRALVASCNTGCLETLCRDALSTQWQDASTAASEPASLTLTAAGTATVGERAQATSLEGAWVGRLSTAAAPAETRGAVQGWAPKTTAR